jgi:hypothetical protein
VAIALAAHACGGGTGSRNRQQPSDSWQLPLTEGSLRESERREELAQDKQERERIDQLASDLVHLYQEGKQRESPGDGWTSLL